MVKVTLIQSRTRPSQTALVAPQVQYDAKQFGSELGAGLAAVGGMFETLKAQEEKVERFDTIGAQSRFEADTKQELAEMQKSAPENGANFFEQAEAAYSRRAAEFLNSIPTKLQPEFAARLEENRKRYIGEAYNFDLAQKNLYFNNVITRSVEDAKIAVDKDPLKHDESRDRILEAIDASGLSEIDKARQKRMATEELASIAYRKAVKNTQAAALVNPATTLAAADLPPVAGGVLAVIAKRESGGQYDIRYGGKDGPQKFGSFADHPRTASIISEGENIGLRSTAAGKYQFTEKTWDAAAKLAGVTDFSPQSQDRAAWAWAQKTIREETGKSVEELIATGDWATLKRGLGATQWMGLRNMSVQEVEQTFKQNAGKFADYSAIQADPRFAALPLEKRQALQKDGEAQANAEYQARLGQIQAQQEALRNQLYTGLFDGTRGMNDIREARQRGILQNYEDIAKAQQIFEKRDGEVRTAMEGYAKLENNGVWLRDDKDDKARADAIFTREKGANSLASRDRNYVDNVLLPRFARMDMLPAGAIAALTSLAQHQNPQNAAYAYETLSRLREVSPVAFGATFSTEMQRNLDVFDTQRNYVSDPNSIVQRINGGVGDVAQRQAAIQLRKTAREQLDTKEFDPTKKATAVFNGWFDNYGGEAPLAARQQTQLTTDYKSLFEENFVAFEGNLQAAERATEKQLKEMWALSNIGGATQLMRLPPEKAGYQPINGSYAWINQQVREELKIPPQYTFTLISDRITEEELQVKRLGRGGEEYTPPSYLVRYTDENGQVRMAMTPNGKMARIHFVMPRAEVVRQENEFQRREAEQQALTIQRTGADQNMKTDEQMLVVPGMQGYDRPSDPQMMTPPSPPQTLRERGRNFREAVTAGMRKQGITTEPRGN